jgi:hypothetical protein
VPSYLFFILRVAQQPILICGMEEQFVRSKEQFRSFVGGSLIFGDIDSFVENIREDELKTKKCG